MGLDSATTVYCCTGGQHTALYCGAVFRLLLRVSECVVRHSRAVPHHVMVLSRNKKDGFNRINAYGGRLSS